MIYTLARSSAEDCVRVQVNGAWPTHESDVDDIIARIYALWAKDRKKGIVIDIRNMAGTPSVLSDHQKAERFGKNL